MVTPVIDTARRQQVLEVDSNEMKLKLSLSTDAIQQFLLYLDSQPDVQLYLIDQSKGGERRWEGLLFEFDPVLKWFDDHIQDEDQSAEYEVIMANLRPLVHAARAKYVWIHCKNQ